MLRKFKKVFWKAGNLTKEETAGISYRALWTGIIVSGIIWLILTSFSVLTILFLFNNTVYSINGLLKLITWFVFFLGGLVSSYKAGFKGWFHGLWAGLFLSLFSVIFLLETVPTLISLEIILFQLMAGMILGTSGGLVGLKLLQNRKDKKGYSFEKAKKERFFRLLDRKN